MLGWLKGHDEVILTEAPRAEITSLSRKSDGTPLAGSRMSSPR